METLDSSKNIDDYINENVPADSIYFPHAVALDDEQLKHDVWATNYLNAAFKKCYEDNDWVIRIYLGTQSGHFRAYPGGARKKDYDPAVRPWYKRAMAYPGKAVLSAPYTDSGGAGTVVTISRAILAAEPASGSDGSSSHPKDANFGPSSSNTTTANSTGGGGGRKSARATGESRVIGVIGMDFNLDHLQKLMLQSNPDCDTGAGACAILDDQLKVVVTDSTSWVPAACDGLAGSWDDCFDPSSACWKAALVGVSERTSCDRLGDNVEQTHYAFLADVESDSISLHRVAGTNTFLAKKKTGTTHGTVSILSKPLDFKGDCEAMFRGVPPRVASGTPLCAAAVVSPTRMPPDVSTAGKGLDACATRTAGGVAASSAAQLTCGAGAVSDDGGSLCLPPTVARMFCCLVHASILLGLKHVARF